MPLPWLRHCASVSVLRPVIRLTSSADNKAIGTGSVNRAWLWSVIAVSALPMSSLRFDGQEDFRVVAPRLPFASFSPMANRAILFELV